MRKFFKGGVLTLLLTATLITGSGVTALAATDSSKTNLASSSTAADSLSDTTSINLYKDYVEGDGSDQTNSESPEEKFTFTIKPYWVWNAGTADGKENGAAYSLANKNIPLLGDPDVNGQVDTTNYQTTVSITASRGNAGKDDLEDKVTVKLPEYKSVGDFWYEVTELSSTGNKTTGVDYMTNDATGTDAGKYYIHVQVTNNSNSKSSTDKFIRTVTLHQTAPATSLDNTAYNSAAGAYSETNKTTTSLGTTKVTDIQNTYKAGVLEIHKDVKGNAGDKNKRFAVTVTFTKPADTIINSDITFDAATSATATTSETTNTIKGQYDSAAADADHLYHWKATSGGEDNASVSATETSYVQVTVYLKDGDTVDFKNIPYGVSYTVAETNYSADGYSNTFTNSDTTHTADKENDDTFSTGTKWVGTGTDEGPGVSGSISNADRTTQDAKDTVIITNTKNSTIDIGVLTSNAPYVAVLVVVAFIAAAVVRRRRNNIED